MPLPSGVAKWLLSIAGGLVVVLIDILSLILGLKPVKILEVRGSNSAK